MTDPGLRSPGERPRRVPWLSIPDWERRFGLVAGITVRSDAGPEDFSAGLRNDDPIGPWFGLLDTFEGSFSTLVVSRQVHGVEVGQYAHRRSGGLAVVRDVDGHVTDRQGMLLCVTVADCIPVYLTAPRGEVVGVLHAGWRGAAAGILERGVQVFEQGFGISAGNVAVHLGVGICGPCYEVSADVAQALGVATEVPCTVDLRDRLARQAEEIGVGQLTRSEGCSRHEHRFHSHRRDGGQAGRMVAFVGRPVP